MIEGFVAVDGGSLVYQRAGTGPGVVLIHPGLWDSRTWDAQFEVFTERYLTVRYDLPGFEPTLEEEAWWEEHAAGLEELVEAGELEAVRRRQMDVWVPLGVEEEAGRRILQIALDNRHELTMDESGAAELDPPAIECLSETSVPTLVQPADHDPPDSQRESRVLAERIPGARVIRMPDVDHVVNMRKPAEFNRVVLGFLDEVL